MKNKISSETVSDAILELDRYDRIKNMVYHFVDKGKSKQEVWADIVSYTRIEFFKRILKAVNHIHPAMKKLLEEWFMKSIDWSEAVELYLKKIDFDFSLVDTSSYRWKEIVDKSEMEKIMANILYYYVGKVMDEEQDITEEELEKKIKKAVYTKILYSLRKARIPMEKELTVEYLKGLDWKRITRLVWERCKEFHPKLWWRRKRG